VKERERKMRESLGFGGVDPTDIRVREGSYGPLDQRRSTAEIAC